MTYLANTPYIFSYLEKGIDLNGRPYLWVINDETGERFTVPAFDFQYSWNDIPQKIVCIVKTGVDGRPYDPPRFEQSIEFILKDNYSKLDSAYDFTVLSKGEDRNSKAYYTLQDRLGLEHRFYSKEAFELGSTIKVKVSGFKTLNNGRIALNLYSDQKQNEYKNTPYCSDPDISENEVEIKGGESQTCEFKSSIVYPAATSKPDIDTQIKEIMREIAGMMNAEGGNLYIGVNDDGIVRGGIQNDFPHLNSSQTDRYSYKKNEDHYMLKILNSIGWHLGSDAKTLTDVSIKSSSSGRARYCIVKISPSEWPVWLNSTELHVRTGCGVTHLKGDNITKYILRKMKWISNLPVINEENAEEAPTITFEELAIPANAEPTVSAPVSRALSATLGLFEQEKAWGHVYFMPEGRYVVHTGDKAPSGEYVYKVAIPEDGENRENYDLVICYENGDTDLVDLKSALDLNTIDKEKDNGWNKNKTIVNAFCVKNNEEKDLIAYVNTLEGKTYIKLHELTALAQNPHKQFGNTGNMTLRAGSLNYAIRVAANEADRIALNTIGLIYRDASRHNGILLDDISNRYKELLENVINLIYTNPVYVNDEAEVDVETSNPVTGGIQESVDNASNELFIINGKGNVRIHGQRYSNFIALLNGKNKSYTAHIEAAKRINITADDQVFFIYSHANRLVSAKRKFNYFNSLIKHHIEYFRTRNASKYRAISQSDFADMVKADDSNISRAMEGFEMISHYGVYDKDDLLTASGGGQFNPIEVKMFIQEMKAEDRKYTDQYLTEQLQSKGVNIERRTVAKYRKILGLPSSRK